MGRDLFATDQQAQPVAPQGQPAPQKKYRDLFAGSGNASEFDQRTAGLTHEQIVEEYRKAPINSPYYDYLVKKIEAPQQGETPEQAELRAAGQKPAGAPSEWLSHFGGFADDRTYGWADEMGAGLATLGGKGYDQALKEQRQFRDALAEEHPDDYFKGQLAGTGVEIAATLGASAPMTWGGRVALNTGLGLGQGTFNGLGHGDTMPERLNEAAWQGGIGAGLGIGLGAIEGGYKVGKHLVKKTAQGTRKIINPTLAAENDFVDRGVRDRVAQFRNEQSPNPPDRRFLTQEDIDAAIARGDDVMASDVLGDGGRRRLKAAANVSEDASNLMQGAAKGRQKVQGQTFMDTLSDVTGDVDPASTVTRLKKMAQDETDAAYGMVENHPNASHLWNNRLQRSISTPEGKEALKDAIIKSRRDAINNGQEIFEPIFEEGPDGLMRWSGQFRRPTGELVNDVQGLGLGFRFWDSVKKSFDDKINSLYKAGYKEEAKAIRKTRDQMLESLDNQLSDGNGNSLYKNARGTAKEFFDAEDAHEAGIKYFSNMGAFKTSETRAAIAKFKPSERELFARGYAASLMHKVSSMGEGEEVAKLFRDPLSRRKLQDALGPALADQLEVITQARAVQGMLGRELQSGSSTVLQNIAQEGLRYTASSSVGGALGYYQTGDYTGLFAGLAAGAGFRFTQRKVVERYANALATLATSRDPAVIARISKKIADDPRMMEFARAVGAGAQRFGVGGANAAGRAAQGASTINMPGGAQRIDPRMPFADGGRVPLANAGLVKKAAQAAGELLGVVKKAEKAPKRITDLGVRAEVDPVMINGKDVSQWSPKDWGDFGRLNGRDDVGPVSDEDFLASLAEVPTLSGRSFTVPGGIDDVERPFSYYDLLHLKSQAVDPNDLHPDVHRRLHNRMVRSMQPGPEFDDVDRYNQLAFGMISPNQPLTPNELAMARVRAKSPEDIQAMADMAPWKLGDDVSKDDRQALSRGIAQHFGLQAKGKGGIGASGSADYSRIADMAKMHSEKPEFYRFKGAGEGGVDDAENWSNFVGRVAAQTPGLSYKTASLGTVWQDPVHAAISAIDRHMAGSFRGAMFDKASDVNKFNRRVVQKFNKGRPRGQGARSFDEMLEMPGGRGVLVDELFVELNRRGKTKLRSAKTGELNPKAPEWARNADWIREPDKVDKMSEAYVRALRENDRLAQENNQGLFANQWMIWDRLRQRLEPHEIMHPSIRHLPRMSLDQIKAADKAHSKAGYKAESGVARPSNPSGLAYFSLAAPAGGLGALVAAQDEEGGFQ